MKCEFTFWRMALRNCSPHRPIGAKKSPDAGKKVIQKGEKGYIGESKFNRGNMVATVMVNYQLEMGLYLRGRGKAGGKAYEKRVLEEIKWEKRGRATGKIRGQGEFKRGGKTSV